MNIIKLLAISLSVIVIGILTICKIIEILPTWQDRGNFGDMFGVLDSFFSGLAFVGLVYTIFVQREDLKTQMKAVDKTNRLNVLATLVSLYSDDEKKYKDTNKAESDNARIMKEHFLTEIKQIENLLNQEKTNHD